MGKFFFCNALIFSVKPSKENQSTVCFLSQNEGISFATLYGGSKSRLKSLVSPWNSGTIYLSKSNTGSFFKINDFEPLKYHLSFREDIYKFLAASMAAEIVILKMSRMEKKRALCCSTKSTACLRGLGGLNNTCPKSIHKWRNAIRTKNDIMRIDNYETTYFYHKSKQGGSIPL